THKTTLNHPLKSAIRSNVNRPYEKRIAKTSSTIIHISKPLQESLSNLLNKEVHLIPNGFETEKFEKHRESTPDRNVFTISFVGTLHTRANPNVFLEGFHKFVRTNRISPDVCQIQFIGDSLGHKRIQAAYVYFDEISDFFSFRPPMSQSEAIKGMLQSHILLSFPLDMEGCCPAKTYEYLASKRPILVSPDGLHRGVIKELLSQTNGGVILNSPQEVARWLEIKFEEFSATGYVTSDTKWSAVEEYSRENQAMKLSQILENAAHNARH
ncbi:hypothetical protein KA005_74290, partial [bacterium]|nr:hypothetical protein [bacterium]